MSKAKHTPGPWEAGNLGIPGRFPCVFIGPHLNYRDNSGNSFRACITINEGPTPEDVERGSGFGATTETAEANARLIAAAPDLLKALEELYDKCEAHFKATGYPASFHAGIGISTINRTRAAIAKVEGLA